MDLCGSSQGDARIQTERLRTLVQWRLAGANAELFGEDFAVSRGSQPVCFRDGAVVCALQALLPQVGPPRSSCASRRAGIFVNHVQSHTATAAHRCSKHVHCCACKDAAAARRTFSSLILMGLAMKSTAPSLRHNARSTRSSRVVHTTIAASVWALS